MPILTNEREPKRGRRSWIPAVLAGVPLLLAGVFLWALLVPLDGVVVIPLGKNGPFLGGVDVQPPPGMLGAGPRWYAFAYRRRMRSGVTWDVHGISLGYRTWSIMQPRR